MPQYCCIKGCTNNRSSGVNLFKFPLAKPQLLSQWITAINMPDFQPTKYSVICSDHFIVNDYVKRPYKKGVRLKNSSVPSVFKPTSVFTANDAKPLDLHPIDSKMPVVVDERQTIAIPSDECVQSSLTGESVLHNIEENVCVESSANDHTDGTIVPMMIKHEYGASSSTATPTKTSASSHSQSKKRKIMSSSTIHLSHQDLTSRKRKMQRKIKTLQQKLNRKEKKIRSLKELLSNLRKKNLLDEAAASVFRNELENKNKNKKGNRYTEEIKQLAVTLHYYSPKAYEYCRTFLQLPHPSSIRNWTSSVNVEPGFMEDVFAEIAQLPSECKNCSLVFDSMSIRKQILWDSVTQKFIGVCDYGNELRIEDSETPATEALVFMLVALNGKFKWPIGYFFINKLTAVTQAELVRITLILSHASGIRVWGVTCDGAFINFKTMIELGCDLYTNYDEMKCFFKHPSTEEKVYFVPDACHNSKLARNALGDCRFLFSESGVISWNHIANLTLIQNEMKLKLANKLSSAHINWKQNAMKVKLAAQTLSSSTADASEFLQNSKVANFQDCTATVEFIRAIDRLFDFLNSRNPFASGFKKPLYLNNLDYLENIIVDKIKYLFSLNGPDKKPIHLSRRKTFIIGLAAAVKSIFESARQLLTKEATLKYLLTYRFSQDHLEIVFSQIRRRNAWNNNPNVAQFRSTMKRILLKNAIKASQIANCTVFENCDFTAIAKFKWTREVPQESNKTCDEDDDDDDDTDHNIHNFVQTNLGAPKLRENVVYYIAGYLSRKLTNKLTCEDCVNSILCNRGDHNYSRLTTYSTFVQLKNRGGLVYASDSVFKTVWKTENEFMIHTNNCNKLPGRKSVQQIVSRVKSYFALQHEIFRTDEKCMESFDIGLEPPHRLILIEGISRTYLQLRMYSFSQYISKEILNPTSQRHKLSKLILFKNM